MKLAGEAARREISPPQAEVLASNLLSSGFSCVLQMPTGSGKTWLAEQAISEVLSMGARAIYLAPLRSLAMELVSHWEKRFAGSRVGIFTGDYGKAGRPYPVSFRDAQVLVMTPERLDACTRAWRTHWSWLPKVDLVVVDEIHLLGDRHRGGRLEGTISRLGRLNPFARVLGLSATLGNRRELADWLGGVEYVSDWRPVPLEWRIVRYRRADEKPGMLVEEVGRIVRSGGKSLVFVQSRRRAEELDRKLKASGFRAGHHHAGLPHPERRTVEGKFRNGEVDVLVATSTLEMGLNLPVRQVVLYDVQAFDGVDFRPLSTNSVWQRVGRAGRPGLDSGGEAVLLAPIWDRDTKHYPQGSFEPIRSGLSDPRVLAEQVVAEVACGLSRTAPQLEAVFGRSLAARQRTLPGVKAVVAEMREAGMLREVDEQDGRRSKVQLRATRLGRVASRHLLAPATVLLFRRALEADEELTFFDLLLLSAGSADCEPVLPVDFEELDALASDLARERSLFLRRTRHGISEKLGVDGKRLLSALKMALVGRAWTRSSDAREVAERYDCYPFEVTRLHESLERLLLAMLAVLDGFEEGAEHGEDFYEQHVHLRERLRALHRMIAGGLDETVVTLTLVSGIGPKIAGRLREAGMADVEDLALAQPADLSAVRGVSSQRAQRWVSEAEDLVQTRAAFRYREVGSVGKVTAPGWPADVDPYRLRRSLDLSVVADERGFLVTGGLEPHLVRLEEFHLLCDCVDAERGHKCKHELAVRLYQGERGLRRLAQRLGSTSTGDEVDLFDLWFSGRSSKRSRGVS
jgi:helicase